MKYIYQLTVLLFFWGLGEMLSEIIKPVIGFPGTVLGMVLLFGALLTGLVREEQIQDCSDFFLNNIGFFFVPVVVGLMTVTGISGNVLLQLTGATILSTMLTLGAAALTVQAVIRRQVVRK